LLGIGLGVFYRTDKETLVAGREPARPLSRDAWMHKMLVNANMVSPECVLQL